jgi:hypothetical protein
MVVHQLFNAARAARSQPLRDEGPTPQPDWIERPSWPWLIWVIMRLFFLIAALIIACALFIALFAYLFSPRSSARQRLSGLLHTLIHCGVGIFLPGLGLALLIAAPGWARSALRSTSLSALLTK